MQQLINHITTQQKKQPQPAATIGFDGFIDAIVKLVKQKDGTGQANTFFNKMADWGNYILAKEAGNFSIELQLQSTKTGGNMPNMAAALAKLGIAVHCVGAMGYPAIDPIFTTLPDLCTLHSFAAPGTCQAIEFNDGKIMLAGMQELNKADWTLLKERISISTLIAIYDNASLIGMLNWGELTASTGFWKGLLHDVLPFCKPDSHKIIFVDLSDCSNRSKEETLAALQLLQEFSVYGKVIISLNHNESVFVHDCFFETSIDEDDIKVLAEKLFTALKIDTLLLRNKTKAIALRRHTLAEKESIFIQLPKLLTGAGDNFNAGFCFAQLMDCGLDDSLLLGHLTAAHYIANAENANWNDLAAAIKKI